MAVKPDASIERRLAMACTRGHRQASLVNEMLVRPVQVMDRSSSFIPGGPWLTVGESRCDWSSYMALKKRLIAVGFVFKQDKKNFIVGTYITMEFPEGMI